MSEKLKALIANLKHKPGVYLMHDKEGTIIYVGKAKDLQKRVSQYFLRPQSGKVFAMVSHVDYFETIITANEKEAFVLEMNLIQTHYPRYNIMLKDDSHYPYIAIKKTGDPYLVIKRNTKDSHYDYFGPFPRSSSAFEMISLLNKIYPIRKCKNLGSQVCLYYHMGQCLGPCVNKIDEEKNAETREEVKSFLRGNNDKARREIEAKLKLASENMEYELASEYKKTLDAIEHINLSQNVETKDKVDRDIFAYASREGYLALAVLLYRKGILLDKRVFVVEAFEDEEEQVSNLISQFYLNAPLPSEVVINSNQIIDNLSSLLDVNFISPTRGKLLDLIIVSKENANNALDEYFMSARLDDNKVEMLEKLGKLLNIKTPYHIELFDNSHLQGSSPVGAMVAFINGEPAKKLYRKFRIESEEKRDDLSSMREVVSRHYLRSKEENKKYPDLILVDGGLNQLHAAREALENIGVEINVFGLYKDDKHHTNGIIDKDGNVVAIEDKAIFFLLTRMQDEVHRFAISFHKEKRNKAMTVSILDNIPGLGNKRKEMIQKAYTDINELKGASISELEQILPSDVAETLYMKLHS